MDFVEEKKCFPRYNFLADDSFKQSQNTLDIKIFFATFFKVFSNADNENTGATVKTAAAETATETATETAEPAKTEDKETV